jgi:hypothetical protein
LTAFAAWYSLQWRIEILLANKPFTVYGPTQVRIIGGSVVDNTTGFTMNSPGNDQFQVFDTILLNTPITTTTAGNGTLVTCTGINPVNSNTPPCNNVGTFGNTSFNTNQAN